MEEIKMYYTESERKPIIPMPACSKYETEYKEIVDKEGNLELKEVGKINIYDKIQEARASVELKELLAKYQPEINENDLTKIEEITADFTNLPENLIEVTNILNNARSVFDQAPVEIKQAFNNNFNEFLAGSQNGTLKSLIEKNKKGQLQGQMTIEETTMPTEEEIEKAKALLKGVNLND